MGERYGSGRTACVAFAPGRANVIGEHTDYNGGLALPFAIAEGVTVAATARPGAEMTVEARSVGERDRFDARRPERAGGWRAYVRGAVAAMEGEMPAAHLEITSTLPMGSGLASSAALTVAVTLALHGLAGDDAPDRLEVARRCSHVESEWAGAETGLLDQLAALYGSQGHALRIDFSSLAVEPVPLALGGWSLVTVDSGETRTLAASGYNARRRECALPEPPPARVRHVRSENARVEAAVGALRRNDIAALGPLLDASHASLRDDFEASTAAVEATVERLRAYGAAGARMMGGGFGGHVLALFGPGVALPPDARRLCPSAGAGYLQRP